MSTIFCGIVQKMLGHKLRYRGVVSQFGRVLWQGPWRRTQAAAAVDAEDVAGKIHDEQTRLKLCDARIEKVRLPGRR